MKKKKDWIPEICYQEGSAIPFIDVPENKEVPDKLFIWTFKRTGEFEPGLDGEAVPIFETDMALFFNYSVAKQRLSPKLLDELRNAFGLEPLKVAEEKGKSIINKAENSISKSS